MPSAPRIVTIQLRKNPQQIQNAGRLLLGPPGVLLPLKFCASNLFSPVASSVPLHSAAPFGHAIWHFEQPIVLAARETPRRRQSRRLASADNKPPGPRNETLRNAKRN